MKAATSATSRTRLNRHVADSLSVSGVRRWARTVLSTLGSMRAGSRAASQLKFQAGLLEAVEQSVIATDLHGAVVYWNRFAESVYGWSSAEALGRQLGELLVPEASEADSQDIMGRLRRGQSWSGEFLVRRRDGTSFPCLVTDSPLRDASGRLVGVIGVSIDISDRKRADEVQARLAAIVTSSEDAIVGIHLDGTISDWNVGAETLYGYTAAEIVGQPMSLLTSSDRASRPVQQSGKRVWRREHRTARDVAAPQRRAPRRRVGEPHASSSGRRRHRWSGVDRA